MSDLPSSSDREQCLERVLADYLHAVEAGAAPDRAKLLKQHPDLAADLGSFFRNRDAMGRMAEPIKQQLPEAETIGVSATPSASGGATIRYFGDYELLEEIARGGMGVVYKARQVSLNRIVALKMILAGQLASAADVARFHTEAEAVANLDHPHIVPIYEVGEHEGQHYFSMKLIEGGSLAASRRDAPASLRDAAKQVGTIARAVHHAHQRGVLHRDLKPGNILIDSQGQPHVTDFGLARRVEGDKRLTQSGAIVGTPSYMAPEQARSEKLLTTGVDVYSLGAVLYELLTGRPPFRAETPLDTIRQVLERDPGPPRKLNPKIDRDLETMCLKCLQKEPERRYESAAALAEDLERWLRGEPIQARRSSLRERVVKWARRRPALAALLLISVVSLLTVSIGGVWYNTRLQVSLDSARRHLYAAHMSEALDAWQHAELARVMELLDAHRPQPGEEDLRGFEWYYLWRLCHRDRFAVSAHRGTVVAVAVAADSQTIATAGADGMVTLLDAVTGKQRSVTPGNSASLGMPWDMMFPLGFAADGSTLTRIVGAPGPVTTWDARTHRKRSEVARTHGATLSADGTLVAWADAEGTIHLVDTVGGQELRRLQAHSSTTLSPAFSPDGEVLACASANTTVQLWNPATGEKGASMDREFANSQTLAVAPKGRVVAGWSRQSGVVLWYPDSGQKRVIAADAAKALAFASLAFAPDGRTLAIGMTDLGRLQVPQGGGSISDNRSQTKSYADFLQIVDLATGKARVLRGHTSGISRVAFSPDSRLLATAGDDMSVRLWDVDTGRESFVLLGHVDGISAIAFAPDGSFLVTGSQDGVVKCWDLSAIRERNVLTGNGSWILALAYSPDGTKLASASAGKEKNNNTNVFGEVRVWDAASGRELATLPADGWAVAAVDFSPDGSTLAMYTEAGVTLWDLSTKQVTARFKFQGKLQGMWAATLHFLADGKTLVTCNAVTGVKVWDVVSGQELPTLKDDQPPGALRPNSLARAPDGVTLAASDWGGGWVQLWDTRTQRWGRSLGSTPITEEKGLSNGGWVWAFMGNSSVAFSPDGRSVAHSGRTIGRGTVQLVDVSSGQDRLMLHGHTAEVWSVAFARDGKTVVTASEDRTIRFWDPVTGDQRLTLRGHEARISTVVFSPDGTTLATASWDGTVRLWRAATKKEVDARSQ